MSEFGAHHNKVIVAFKSGTAPDHIELAIKDIEAQGGKITHRYNAALLGFAAEIPDDSVQALTIDEKVDYVEADGPVSIYARNLLNKN
ncbi:hypothetical protein BG000_004412 [Podila horticola]|nr:hypothetical protein BG000_004412 [Podila horticola]